MPEQFFIPQMINALRNKTSFKMTDGAQKRDFLLVDDVVQAMILSAQSKNEQNEILNVCSGNAVSLKQLATEINTALQGGCEIKFGALPYRENEVWNMVGDNTKIKDTLGFKVRYNLKNAISNLLS